MKSFLFLAVCLILISCNKATDCEVSESKEMREEVASSSCNVPDDSQDSTVPFPDNGVPHEAFSFDASIKFVNFEREQEEKVNKAIEIIRTVIASEEFREKVINFTYNGKKQFVDNKGLTNEQIYAKILKGSEKLIPGEDYEMDIELELFTSSSSTVGYTKPDTVRIWMNTKFFTPYTTSQVAGNIFHEWTHKLGFDHAFTNTPTRPYSVPYAIGYLIRDLGKKYE